MKNKEKAQEMCCETKSVYKCSGNSGGGNAIYGLGVIGALFYFLQKFQELRQFCGELGKQSFGLQF